MVSSISLKSAFSKLAYDSSVPRMISMYFAISINLLGSGRSPFDLLTHRSNSARANRHGPGEFFAPFWAAWKIAGRARWRDSGPTPTTAVLGAQMRRFLGDFLDVGRGDLDQLMRQVRESTCSRQLVPDVGDI